MSRPAIVGSAARPAPEDVLAELLARVGKGDEVAFAEFYRLTSRRVFGLVSKVLGDRTAAEEVTLEVFTKIWSIAGQYRSGRGSALAWLLTVARNRALDCRRARAAEPTREDINELTADLRAAEPSPADALGSVERANQVRAALAALPRGQRDAIAVAYFGGYTHIQAARALDVPLGTLKTRIRSGMVALRRALGDAGRQR